jgi:hypothetical protein
MNTNNHNNKQIITITRNFQETILIELKITDPILPKNVKVDVTHYNERKFRIV